MSGGQAGLAVRLCDCRMLEMETDVTAGARGSACNFERLCGGHCRRGRRAVKACGGRPTGRAEIPLALWDQASASKFNGGPKFRSIPCVPRDGAAKPPGNLKRPPELPEGPPAFLNRDWP